MSSKPIGPRPRWGRRRSRSPRRSLPCPRPRGERNGGAAASRTAVILAVHSPPEDPAAERPKPLQHVVHVAEIHQLNQVAVKVSGKEKRMAARRSLRARYALDPLARQVFVPSVEVPH